MANIVDPDETARYESSHLDLHYLHRCWFWSGWAVRLKHARKESLKWLSDRCLLNTGNTIVWEGLWFVIVALPGLFSYLFFMYGIRKYGL